MMNTFGTNSTLTYFQIKNVRVNQHYIKKGLETSLIEREAEQVGYLLCQPPKLRKGERGLRLKPGQELHQRKDQTKGNRQRDQEP